ncbi:16S rRNA (uracil(1498)-N(3))-methyltransferase [Natronincola ferrireducens]|uniref:Ribosomal RNA small subunit methyltransferase E n=1 Tax=Natronincola ferrireducens TaxID=393762 RepID=A0A1G9BDU5_9FIRM|nr:16S rRNA (uracil(1498)-N(3))-methyltransferase [Natronincola ferrireducens]SDK37702.1 16S rRNA (uracil1498-N3)-methyltransferase [Natronincola ferrireducens]
MNRFFVSSADINRCEKKAVVTGEDVKHMSKVLRLTVGDTVELCDGEKYQYRAEIKSMDKNQVLLSIIEEEQLVTEPSIDVILYQGIPKATKMELIIQKTTELGIKEIIPVITNRTIVHFKDNKDKEKKVERWQKIAEEAAKQSKRGMIPSIHSPISFKEALEHSRQNHINIIAYEKESKQSIKNLLKSYGEKKIGRIGLWIGPEGGYEEEEIELALMEDIQAITLGPRILRTETAGLTVLSILMYDLGDLGG